MSRESDCPSLKTLRHLSLGQVAASEAEPLERHLEACARCVQTMQGLASEDTLVEALRNPPGAVPMEDSPDMTRLMEELKHLQWIEETSTTRALLSDAVGQEAPPPTEEAYSWLETGAGHAPWLGGYRVLRELGSGGMGVVFEAEDRVLGRRIALKVLRVARQLSRSARERFFREARAAAAVRHDHIVTVYQAGEDRGIPFLAMELLEGETLEACLQREGRLSVAEVLRIGREIAEGLAAAHEHGLIHRDIKPANIWLEASPGRRASPGRKPGEGRVKILDFGLARALADDVALTQSGTLIGTPGYVAPEQARGEAVDSRADLFSLGCILYRLSAGRSPFGGRTALEALATLATQTPPPVTELNAEITPALGELIARLLSKAPAERPRSAQAIVEALRAIEATHATPQSSIQGPGTAGLVASSSSRPRWPLVGIAVLACVVIGGGFALQIILQITDRDGKRVQEVPLQPGEKVEFVQQPTRRDAARPPVTVLPAVPPLANLFDAMRREQIALDDLAAAGGGDPATAPRELVAVFGDSRLREWTDVTAVMFSPDGKQVTTTNATRRAAVWEAATGRLLRTLAGAELSPDGKFFVDWPTAALRESASGKVLAVLQGQQAHSGELTRIAFHSDSPLLATASSDQTVRLWDLARGVGLGTFRGHAKAVRAVVFHPTQKRLASGSDDGVIKLWDTITGQEVHSVQATNSQAVANLAFSPDGRRIASASGEPVVKFWDTDGLKEAGSRQAPFYVGCLAFSPDGKQLAVGGSGREVRVWQAETQEVLFDLSGHQRVVKCLAFSPDGKRLACAGEGGTVRIWDLTTRTLAVPLTGHTAFVTALGIYLGGKHLASASADGSVRVWEVATRSALAAVFENPFGRTLAVSANGKRLALNTFDEGLRVFEPGTTQASLDRPIRQLARPNASSVALSPNGDRLAAAHVELRVWNVDSGEELWKQDGLGGVHCVSFSADGERLGTAGSDGTVRIWDARTGKELLTLKGPWGEFHLMSMAFSPDGKRLAAGRADEVKIWDAGSGQEVVSCQGEGGLIPAVAFSPDGSQLAAATYSGRLMVWDTRSGKLERHWQLPGLVNQVTFASDGRHLITGNGNGTLYVLRLSPPPRG